MEPKVITVLPIDEMRVIKQIFIVTESRQNNEISIGHILYERKFTTNYKFKETPKEERNFDYYLEYPKQDSYPNDQLDHLILQSIRNTYPKSVIRNHSVICNVDKEKIEVLRNRLTEKSSIKITPGFSDIDIYNIAGKQYKWIEKEITIYADSIFEEFKNPWFFGYYDVNESEILERIMEIKFL